MSKRVPDPRENISLPEIGEGDRLSIPQHIAIIMDGNGRWANQRGLPRTAGHEAGEDALMDTIAGAIEAGVKVLSVYAFSTENWKRSPAEVKFLMGYSRRVLRSRCDELDAWNVRVRWSGRRQRLWKSVISELERAAALTKDNTGLTLVMNLNYGGQAELVDAARGLAQAAVRGEINPDRITEKTLAKYLYLPDLPEVDLLIRTSGEQRISNYMLWQIAYAECVFVPEAWPDFGRENLWRVLDDYTHRERRFGGAVDQVQNLEGS
ncbi:polyprenyl diphosphate synthase [Boudabousia marimammalium]|uniref:Isoprenyl transferase n=1 Tax=Boudabousia marimammalium TaxID=156892 RepID=A0A1Q5PP12_9ACTO|nr:polyprenyl diphosphate synthase [Boudabousia marimammalium]OKL49314.1 isoprenyl transferase [Boudabousia marimammalium]